MMLKSAHILATVLAVYGLWGSAQALEGIECNPGSICFSTDTGIPFRVLTKLDAKIFLQANEQAPIRQSNLSPLQPYFVTELIDVVFDRSTMESSGWYAVTPAPEMPASGYMLAQDVVPWRQALAVAYTNPGASERRPVVMYQSLEALETTLADIEGQTTTGDRVQAAIDSGTPPQGVITRERNVWTDIDENFYLMPIIDHDNVSQYYSTGEMNALHVTVLTGEAGDQQRKGCDVAAADVNTCQASLAKAGPTSGRGVDVVFVIDMTNSMSPYLDAVKNAMRDVTRKLAEETSGGPIRFGIVGYRDNIEVSPQLKWVTKTFSDTLLEADAFISLLASDPDIASSEAGSSDTPEEVFAGVRAAIEAPWSPKEDAARMMVLIGDASGHEATHEKSTTGLDEKALKDMASAEDIYIAALYVGEDRAFHAVTSSGESGFEGALRESILRMVTFVKTGNFQAILSEGQSNDPAVDSGTAGALLGAARAAFVDYLGAGAAPPPSVTGWALDRDLVDYEKVALDVRVLMTKEDVQNLIDFLSGLLAQLETQSTTNASFFGQAQAASTATTYDLSLDKGQQLNKAGAMPGAIRNLPYRSEIMTMTLEEFKNSSVDDRTRIEERLHNLVKYYEAALSNTDAWVLLNEDGVDDDKVFLMKLDWMP